jgi:hypothetical protein
MSLEQKIEALTTAVEALTAKMSGASASAGTPAADKPAKKAAAEYTPKFSKDEMTAALNEVKEKFGTPVAKEIVTGTGKADKMANITDPKLIDACYEAAKAKMKEAEDDV